MMWKIYRWCCWYNILICAAFSLLMLYLFMQRPIISDLWPFLFAEGVVFIIGFKNRIALKFLRNIKEKEVHRNRLGLLFYFLWLLNAVLTVIYIYSIYDTAKYDGPGGIKLRSAPDIAIASLFLLAVLTLVYTILLDIPLERKARKQVDFASELFKDEI